MFINTPWQDILKVYIDKFDIFTSYANTFKNDTTLFDILRYYRYQFNIINATYDKNKK